jgi:hypothetical protein
MSTGCLAVVTEEGLVKGSLTLIVTDFFGCGPGGVLIVEHNLAFRIVSSREQG